MFIYLRNAHYHETDQMGIIHHSNYIKWMEEARVSYLDSLGISYYELEKAGIISPVVDVHVSFKHPAHFSDQVRIHLKVNSYSGVRLVFQYEMRTESNLIACADSTHCFQMNGRIVSLKKVFPQADALLLQELEKSEN